jgi:hypothetical protein
LIVAYSAANREGTLRRKMLYVPVYSLRFLIAPLICRDFLAELSDLKPQKAPGTLKTRAWGK